MAEIDARRLGMPKGLGIVVSRFNSEVTTKLLEGAKKKWVASGGAVENLTVVWVPGAVEIPLAAKLLCDQGAVEAVVCLGAVIRGDTDHYDYVCQSVTYGCQKLSLETRVPILFGVLTTDNEEQAFERTGGKHGHKGADCVEAAIEMANLVRALG